jgi:mRNA-degrading endonuclease RelE of RelBE toxin-antitoxin system
MAKVVITEQAQHQFDRLPAAIQNRIEKVFRRLEKWPAVSGTKPLSGNLAGRFRIRTGDYRVQFFTKRTGNDEVVTIEKVGHRDGFYGD